MINALLAMIVPTRLLKRLAHITGPGDPADDAMVDAVPDTWLPPHWIRRGDLGAAHPNHLASGSGASIPLPRLRPIVVTEADIARERCDPIAEMYRLQRERRR